MIPPGPFVGVDEPEWGSRAGRSPGAGGPSPPGAPPEATADEALDDRSTPESRRRGSAAAAAAAATAALAALPPMEAPRTGRRARRGPLDAPPPKRQPPLPAEDAAETTQISRQQYTPAEDAAETKPIRRQRLTPTEVAVDPTPFAPHRPSPLERPVERPVELLGEHPAATPPTAAAAPTDLLPTGGFPELDWAAPRKTASPRRPASPPSSPPPSSRSTGRGSGQPPRRRGVVLASSAVVVAVLATVAVAVERWQGGDDPRAGVSLSSNPDDPPAPSTAPKATAPATPRTTVAPVGRAKPKFGVFRGTSLREIREFEDWAGVDVDYVLDYSARDSWSDIADPDYMLSEWRDSGYRVVYGLPMLPTQKSATLEAGADGKYDQYFRALARRLVAADQENAILRVGWEFNTSSSRWRPDDPAVFKRFWRRIVKAMRSVDGQKFEFDWNVNANVNPVDGLDYYPGDDVVDYVGVDAYDISWEPGSYPYPSPCDAQCRLDRQMTAWDGTLNGPRGLAFWAEFARTHGKPMSVPEWGMWERADRHGGGDNAYYIQQMYDFFTNPANNVAYQAYFESRNDRNETHRLTDLDQGGREFRRLFGK